MKPKMSRPASRAQIRNTHNKKLTLREMMTLRKKQMEEGDLSVPDSVALDPYEICYKYLEGSRRATLVGTETEVMCDHKNDWDSNHPECAARLYGIINRIAKLCLLTRCDVLPFDTACSLNDVLLIHSNSLYETLKRISELRQIDEREQEATKYDGVYFSEDTFNAAMRALTWTINVTEQVCRNKYHNGYAIVRPPGHHARHNAFEGYCFFNNVAVAAQKCLNEKLSKKILIVDFDVHHGDGTQEAFYNRKDVLYFSIHRYENGLFWPNLKEGNFDYIGNGEGKGYNVNVPINKTGARDTDYLAIVLNLLLPIAYEFKPDLIMISAGYDAAIGCPEGEMLITPGFYSHIVQLLSGIADGRIVMVLEGGYFIPSLCESAAMSIKGLLNDPCPLLEETGYVEQSVVDTINNCKGVLYDYWNCFSAVERFQYTTEHKINPHEDHVVAVKYFGEVEKPPFTTTGYYPELNQLAIDDFTSFIKRFRRNKNNYKTFQGTGYAFDPTVLLHAPNKKAHSLENPARLLKILELMEESKLMTRCIKIEVQKDRNDYEHCTKVHKDDFMEKLISKSLKPLQDLYINEHTAKAAMTSVSVLLTVVDAVITEKVTNAVALIRPPGHHATSDEAQGFCFLNNVSIAAKYAKEKHSVSRILIVDFDIHHGNGTQDVFYNSRDVLYISIHRYENGNYYPFKKSAGAEFIGHGPGEGFNVNIPFSNGSMGNSEYLAAFLNVVLPIAYAFKPELVIVSAGFDAGINDPLGGYTVTPEMYGQFIYLLKPLASGRLIIALEGGYNVNTTGYGMLMCIKALRGESVPVPGDLFTSPMNKSAAQTIREVIRIQQQYWPSLNVLKRVTDKIFHYKYNKEFKEEIYKMEKFDITNE